MAMTRHEADERARYLWGMDVDSVTPALPFNGSWWVDARGRSHRIDGNGHTNCHEECRLREMAVDNRGNNPPAMCHNGWGCCEGHPCCDPNHAINVASS